MKVFKNTKLEDVKIKDIKKFVKKVYNATNGKINPIYPSRYLEFYKKPSIEFMNETRNISNIMGQCVYDHIAINQYELKRWLDENMPVIDIYEFKGLIIGVVLHELSHMDQRYNLFDQYKNYPNKNTIESEVANDFNVQRYIDKYETYLRDKLGSFDPEFYSTVTYDKSECKNPVKYGKINDVRERTMEILSIVSGLNFFEMIKSESLDDISYLKILIGRNKKITDLLIVTPMDTLLTVSDKKIIHEAKEINEFLVDNVLNGTKADVFLYLEKTERNLLVFTIDIQEYSKPYVLLKDAAPFDCTMYYSNKDDELSLRMQNIVKTYNY